MSAIRRGFVDLPHGQMHYRTAGEGGEPLLILHASPGSSRQQLRLIEDFAGEAQVFAPDTPGNGDSVALGAAEPSVADLAAAMLGFIDALGLATVRVYGSHTGAAIAAELAIMAPERVSHLVLDGVALVEGEELRDILENYAKPFEPDLEGAYLMRLFHFCRDQYLFYPWYRRTREARRDGGMGSPEDFHAWLVEVMKASTTYHLNYRAAFQWPADERLPLIGCPVLMAAASNDPLDETREALTALIPLGRTVSLPRLDDPVFREKRRSEMARFFATASSHKDT